MKTIVYKHPNKDVYIEKTHVRQLWSRTPVTNNAELSVLLKDSKLSSLVLDQDLLTMNYVANVKREEFSFFEILFEWDIIIFERTFNEIRGLIDQYSTPPFIRKKLIEEYDLMMELKYRHGININES